MSIKKHYLKKNEMCKITFNLQEQGDNVDNVKITGEFNNWDKNCEPMKKLKLGGFSQSLNLPAGKSYQFKYLINDSIWANDPDSDGFVPNGFGVDQLNSLIIV